MNDIKVTVFTPTYNRVSMIGKLYESLKNQSNNSFEWIIVDDGQDSTIDLVGEFRKEANFPIHYFKSRGERGISRAFNLMLTKANGFIVMKVDDDDILTGDAIEKILEFESTIATERTRYAGVSGLRAYSDGRIIGGEWKESSGYIDATNLERAKYGLEGDKAEAYYLDVLKKYGPFPTVQGEHYTWEGILWDRIAHAGLKIRWFKEVIYITEYLPDGATANRIAARENNFGTYTIFVSDRLQYKEVPLISRLILSCRYFELAKKKGMRMHVMKEKFANSKAIAGIGYVLSFFTKFISMKENNY